MATRMGLSAPKNSHQTRMSRASPAPARTSPAYLSTALANRQLSTTQTAEPATESAPVAARTRRFDHSGAILGVSVAAIRHTTPMLISKTA